MNCEPSTNRHFCTICYHPTQPSPQTAPPGVTHPGAAARLCSMPNDNKLFLIEKTMCGTGRAIFLSKKNNKPDANGHEQQQDVARQRPATTMTNAGIDNACTDITTTSIETSEPTPITTNGWPTGKDIGTRRSVNGINNNYRFHRRSTFGNNDNKPKGGRHPAVVVGLLF